MSFGIYILGSLIVIRGLIWGRGSAKSGGRVIWDRDHQGRWLQDLRARIADSDPLWLAWKGIIYSSMDDPKNQTAFEQNIAKGKRVVLLAENDPFIRNMLLLILHKQSFAVLVAVDGQEAIELSRRFQGEIHLLVTDMEMPRLGGDNLGELLMAERPGVRILQISGQMAAGIIGRNLSLTFLHKPFLPSALIAKIDEVLSAPPGTCKVLTEI